jgi:hypothetical protein
METATATGTMPRNTRRTVHECAVPGCTTRTNGAGYHQVLESGETVFVPGDAHVVYVADIPAGEVRYKPDARTLFFGPREVVRP